MQAAPAGPDFSSLERHLLKITSQIEALQRPDHVEQSIAAFRSELAEIRHAITEAMPRRAIESIENEIRSLSRRIDDNRQNGSDGQTLASIERALGEIREVLRSLTPAEQLAGYDEAIRNLGAKLDLILRSNDDPSTVQQLESAIAALRAHRLQRRLQRRAGAARPTTCTRCRPRSTSFPASTATAMPLRMLEQRIAALTSTLETASSRRPPAKIPNCSKARCARCPNGSTACRSATTTRRRSPISNSACPICWSAWKPPATDPPRPPSISAGSRKACRTSCAISNASTPAWSRSPTTTAMPAAPPQPMDTGIVDIVKRELSDIRFSQSETDRRTQDSLETVHSTLGHVVDRLAMIEGDLRTVRTAPARGAPARSAGA